MLNEKLSGWKLPARRKAVGGIMGNHNDFRNILILKLEKSIYCISRITAYTLCVLICINITLSNILKVIQNFVTLPNNHRMSIQKISQVWKIHVWNTNYMGDIKGSCFRNVAPIWIESREDSLPEKSSKGHWALLSPGCLQV